MQRLFNGASQQVLGTCKCPHCAPSKAGQAAVRSFGQRATISFPRPFVTSTIWLTATFTTAVTLDGHMKDRRKDQWNKVLDTMKQDVQRHTKENDQRQAQVANLWEEELLESVRAERRDGAEQVLEYVDHNGSASVDSNESSLIRRVGGRRWEAQTKRVRAIRKYEEDKLGYKTATLPAERGKQRSYLVDPSQSLLDQAQSHEAWPANTAYLQDPELLQHESPYHPDAPKPRTLHWTPKKTEIITISTNLLLLNILRRIQKSYSEKAITVPETLQDVLARFDHNAVGQEEQALLGDLYRARQADADLQSYEHRQTSIPLARWHWQETGPDSRTSVVNDELRAIFETAKKTWRGQGEVLARVYDLLKGSRTAPDLYTYNTLIAGFSDRGMARLTHDTIHNLRRCQLRPNETTVATVIQHYTRVGQKRYFNRWMRILAGEFSGLALANQGRIYENDRRAPVLLEADDGTITRLQTPSPKVFGAIIAASLRFEGLEEALNKCKTLEKVGWSLSMDAIGPLLRECTLTQDFDKGRELWSLVKRLEASTRDREWKHGVQTPPAHVYAAMLDLTIKAGMKADYNAILQQAQAAHPEAVGLFGQTDERAATTAVVKAPPHVSTASPVKTHGKVQQQPRSRSIKLLEEIPEPAREIDLADLEEILSVPDTGVSSPAVLHSTSKRVPVRRVYDTGYLGLRRGDLSYVQDVHNGPARSALHL